MMAATARLSTVLLALAAGCSGSSQLLPEPPLAAAASGAAPGAAAAPGVTARSRGARAFAGSGVADWTRQPAPTAEPAFVPPSAQRFQLPNGLAVVTIEEHSLPIVSLSLIVAGAGAAADPPGKAGLAAYTADLLDEGAGALSAIGIAEEQARLGAELELHVDADVAQLSADTLQGTLDETLALVTTIVTRPRFAPAEAERVKGDRATSLALRRDRPLEVAGLVLAAALYGADSPYGHPISGGREELASISLKDARAFYAARWRPSSMTLVVAGDVDPARLIASLSRSLGRWRPAEREPAPQPAAERAKAGARLLLVDRPGAAQSDVRIGIVGPERKDPRFFAFEVFRTALGEGFTSRLVQRLREQLGITYGAAAWMDWRVRPGPFLIASAFVTAATAQGLTETISIVDGLGSAELPREELEAAKQQLIRALPERFETNAATVSTFAELVLLGLPDDWYARYAAGMSQVTAADVTSAARALVPAQQLVVSIVGDLALTRASLERLGLGTPALYDPEGQPLPGAAPY